MRVNKIRILILRSLSVRIYFFPDVGYEYLNDFAELCSPNIWSRILRMLYRLVQRW